MSDLQNTLDHLPTQFVALTAAAWTPREQMRAMKMVNDACPGLDGNALLNTLKSASTHFQTHSTLDGWSPKRHSVGSEFARIDREASAQRRAALQAAGFKPRYATAPEVRHVMKTAHDVCMTEGTKPSAAAMLRDAGVPAKEATRLASKGNRNISTEWQAQSQHPARTAMR
ncbi:helix-turn-helix domain-containing protein, partial [Pseudomonas syringae pv. actinidiae]|nr:helix-turn-helix domain-containing protein [Pseudomonas syringae pv. actinidiae]